MADEKPTTLGQKLDWLIKNVPGPDGTLCTKAELARLVTLYSGESCDRGYIGLLVNGRRVNPTMRILEALAEVFGIDPGIFFNDSKFTAVRDELAVLANLKAAGVDTVALRSLTTLTPEQLQAVVEQAQATRATDTDS